MRKSNGHKTLKTVRDLSFDQKNANKGTPRGLQMVEDSLRQYGAGRSILADKQGRIIAGNKTLQSASDIDLPIRVIETDGKELVVVQRTDLDLNDPKARELAIADNRAGQVGLEWDAEILAQLKDEGVELSGMFTEKELAAMGHLEAAKSAAHPNRHLINKINQIGAANVGVAVIEMVSSATRFEREYFWINKLLAQGSRLVNLKTTPAPSRPAVDDEPLALEHCTFWIGFYSHYAEHVSGGCSLKTMLALAYAVDFQAQWSHAKKTQLVGAIRACELFEREASRRAATA